MIHRHFLARLFASAAIAAAICPMLRADDTREVVGPDGRRYRETTQTYKRLVPETKYEARPYTVYTPRTTTEYHSSTRTVYTPVTEYQWEPYLTNRWNPFASPSVQYRYVPKTRWEIRNEPVQIPLTKQEMVAETRTSHVPVLTHRVEEHQHTTRVAISDPAGGSNSAIATRPIGSTGQLSNDPPRAALAPTPLTPTQR